MVVKNTNVVDQFHFEPRVVVFDCPSLVIIQEPHVDGRTGRSETSLFLRKNPYTLNVVTDEASDYLQQHITG